MIARPRRKLEVITNSRLKGFRRCRRYHHLRYELGILPQEDAEELRFGTLIHLALELWWILLLREDELRDARLAYYFERLAERPEGDRLGAIPRHLEEDDRLGMLLWVAGAEADLFLQSKARAMLTCYHERWSDAAGELEPLAVEHEFYVPLVNPETGKASTLWRLGGKMDVLVRDHANGNELIIDHKTTTEDLMPGSRYWRRLVMDSQPSAYYDGAKQLGYDPAGFMHDVLRKPSIRPAKATPEEQRRYTKEKVDKKTGVVLEPSRLYAADRAEDETPEEYEQRCLAAIREQPEAWLVREVVPRLEGDLYEFQRDLWDDAKLMREGELSGRNPRNPDACELYGRLCPFFDVCTGAGTYEDPAKFAPTDNPHPELDQLPADEEV